MTGIQMNRKELIKTLMVVLNCNKPFGFPDLYKIIPEL